MSDDLRPDSAEPGDACSDANADAAPHQEQTLTAEESSSQPVEPVSDTQPPQTFDLERILRGAGGDALTYFPVRFLPALTSLITVPVFTGNIDPADYGLFYLVSSATSLASTLAIGWISPSVIRFYWACEKENRRDAFTATTLWVALATLAVAAVILTAILAVVAPRMDPGIMRLLPIGLASMVTASTVTVLQQIQRAANRAKAYARIANTVTVVVTLVSVLLVWQFSSGSAGILLGTVSGNLLVLPFLLRHIAKEGSLAPRRVEKELAREYFGYGFPIMLANVSSWALVLSDRYIIGALRDAAEVGIYSVTYGLGDKIMQLFVQPLSLTMGPVMIKTFEKQGQRLAERVQTQFTRYYLLVTMPLFAGIAAAGQEFMVMFAGEKYHSAYQVLSIVAAATLAYGLTQIAGVGVSLHKKTKIIMTNTMLAAAFQIGANLLLVPTYGYRAAAWTTLVSYLLLLFVTWLRSRPYMAWQIPWLDVARIGGSSLAMWAVLYFAFPPMDDLRRSTALLGVLLAQVAVGMTFYIASVVLLGAVRKNERDAAVSLFRRLLRLSSSRR